jgi:hypothetical protein
MARQLVFTSAPQGLTPGRTGYCTVARHGDLRERLVPILESLSVFPADWQPAPVVCTFRWVDVAGSRFPVLSRLVDAGFDYTHRNHYLAHHLILDPAEAEFAPTAADVFLRWPGWLNRWDGPPRWLNESDLVNLAALPASPAPPLPALAWKNIAGDAGHAVLLLDGALPANRVLRCQAGREGEMLHLFRESAALLPAAERWHAEFTNCLLPAESLATFRWAGVRAGSPPDALAARSAVVLDLTRPETLPMVPTNATARLARGEATMPTRPATAPSSPRTGSKAAAPASMESVAPIRRPPPRPAARKGLSFWILAPLAGIVVGVLAVMLMLSTTSNPPPTLALPPPVQPPASATPPVSTEAVANEQALLDIEQLADHGKFLDALAKWKDFDSATPDLAQAHADLLNSRLLPGARQEWLNDVGQISTQLNSGPVNSAALSAQLAALHGVPRAWPFPDPEGMENAENTVATMLNFLGQLPDAPVWLVDNLTAAGSGPDYQDATAVVSIPELDTLLGSAGGKFRVSAAAATSIKLPPPEEWFSFKVLDVDYGESSFLILHDVSRGDAGGRFLQFAEEAPGKIRVTWRQFQPNAAIFQRFPANDPLRPRSREMWLHFAGEPPLPSLYLLLRRLDNTAIQSWKPVSVPLEWLSINGAPATVALPPWLENNLLWHASAGQSFHLEPATLSPVAAFLPALNLKPAATPGATQYPAAGLREELQDKVNDDETNLAHARSDLQDLLTAANGSVDRRPPQGSIDLAAETVKKIQQDIDQAQAAAQAAADPAWPAAAAPWLLFYTVASKDTLIFLQFNPHETGPTP